jgi:hypothetical protein
MQAYKRFSPPKLFISKSIILVDEETIEKSQKTIDPLQFVHEGQNYEYNVLEYPRGRFMMTIANIFTGRVYTAYADKVVDTNVASPFLICKVVREGLSGNNLSIDYELTVKGMEIELKFSLPLPELGVRTFQVRFVRV